jgi:hypothetical protein
MALSVTGRFSLDAILTKALDLAPSSFAGIPASDLQEISLAHGTGAGQVDLLYRDTGAPGSGTTTDIDLAGSLTDQYGDAVVFAKVKLLWFRSPSTNTVNFTLFGDAASVPFLGTAATTHIVTPGGLLVMYNPTGFAVTATTGDILQITVGAAASQSYQLIIAGTSA